MNKKIKQKIKDWVMEDGVVKRGSKIVVERAIDLTIEKALPLYLEIIKTDASKGSQE